jgi:hypothetical protein
MKLIRKADYFVILAVAILGALNNATGLQLLPMAIFAVLGYIQLYAKKDVKLWIIVLSVIMIGINLMTFSLVDVILWLATLIVFAI